MAPDDEVESFDPVDEAEVVDEAQSVENLEEVDAPEIEDEVDEVDTPEEVEVEEVAPVEDDIQDAVAKPEKPPASAVKQGFIWAGRGLAALIGAAAFFWYGWAPDFRPEPRTGEVVGVNVAAAQGSIDWDAVATDDVECAIIRASAGEGQVDPQFESNWRRAREAGLDVGAYHFFQTCGDGVLQGENLLNVIPDDGDLPIAIGIEPGSECEQDPRSEDEIRGELQELISTVEAERGPLTYSLSPGFDYLDDITGDRTEWLRSIISRPDNDGWGIWQYSFFAEVEGIEGRVDMNLLATDRLDS